MHLPAHTSLTVATLTVLTGISLAQSEPPAASNEAAAYLQAALDQIEERSRVYSTDWQSLRVQASAAIEAAGGSIAE